MRFGFLGLGRAARLYHLPAVRQVAGAVAVGGADAAAQQRGEWERTSGMRTYATLAELLDREHPDVVIVATPPDLHAEGCLEALAAGTHVICEKPFAPTVADADRVIAAAQAARKQVAVNHQFREMPIIRALRDTIAAGREGRLAFCQVWQLMNLAPWDEPTPWRAGMARRTLLEGGVHLVDLLITLFGEAPHALYARHSSGFHDDPEADAVQVLTLEFSQGRLGLIAIDRLCQGGTRYLDIRADCERASLRASLGGRAFVQLGSKRAERPGVRLDLGLGGLAWSEHGARRKVLARNPRDVTGDATARLLQLIVPALAEGREPPSSAREARDVIAVIEAAYAAAATGKRVDLQPLLAS